MAEVEKTNETDATSIEELRRENREFRQRIRELNEEARDHRLERNEARKLAKDLEAQYAGLTKEFEALKAKPADSAEEVERLRKELRTVKHRSVFDRLARDADVHPGRAMDDLWSALAYDAEGDADEDDLKARVEAARADRPYLFRSAPAAGETPAPAPANDLDRLMKQPAPAKPETPPTKPGPGGTGRGAPADGAGAMKVRKSDLQSFDPRVNPMMDRHKASQIEQAKRDGKLVYIDE